MIWAGCIAILLLLAMEQRFGIFDMVTNLVRGMAEAENWYGQRRAVQREAVLGLGLAGSLLGFVLLIGLRRHDWPLRMAAFATVGLLALALVKAVSLHGLDALFGTGVPGTPLTLGSGLELLGLALVLMASLVAQAQVVPERDRRLRS